MDPFLSADAHDGGAACILFSTMANERRYLSADAARQAPPLHGERAWRNIRRAALCTRIAHSGTVLRAFAAHSWWHLRLFMRHGFGQNNLPKRATTSRRSSRMDKKLGD